MFMYFIVIILCVLLFTGVAVWLMRGVLTQDVNHKIEDFNKKLKVEMDRTLEEFKRSLDEQRMLFRAMQETKTNALVGLYGMLVETKSLGKDFLKEEKFSARAPRAVAIADGFTKLLTEYQKNAIHFSKIFSDYLENLLSLLDPAIAALREAGSHTPKSDKESRALMGEMGQAWVIIEDQFAPLINEMKREYRKMSGSADRWSD